MRYSKYGFPVVEKNDCFMITDVLNAISIQLDKVIDDIRHDIDVKINNEEIILSEVKWDYIINLLKSEYNNTGSKKANSLILEINEQRRGN